ncbi:ABC transporter ATP-binding protein [Alistipes sp. OttesenSCG-928-B03]|nr:ABC transporter ATP-binding protein [Alistipes sp. OttesenSCG-928-B03]
MSLISINGLGVNYGETIALEGVDLDILEGDFLGIIGPNGGGKTTLVKAIIGAVKHSGTINYSTSLNGQRGHRIGYLPQMNDFDTKFPISILEVVMSGLQSSKKLKSYNRQDEIKACNLLTDFGIADIAIKPIGQVSGGQMQRALLCRSLISDPKLLILDEPANFVDNKFEKELYELLRELNKNVTIIMVSHDLGTITSVVKSIVCVNKHVHRHDSNVITAEQLANYDCPIQLITHGSVPHTVLEQHD